MAMPLTSRACCSVAFLPGNTNTAFVANDFQFAAEFDFRHNTRHLTDGERVMRLMGQLNGTRLPYRPSQSLGLA